MNKWMTWKSCTKNYDRISGNTFIANASTNSRKSKGLWSDYCIFLAF